MFCVAFLAAFSAASMFFDGEDVSFDSDDEKFDAFSLTVRGDIPEPTFTGVSFDADAKTITLTGTNLDYIGDVGTNVKDQLDWDKFVWDVNGDGRTDIIEYSTETYNNNSNGKQTMHLYKNFNFNSANTYPSSKICLSFTFTILFSNGSSL